MKRKNTNAPGILPALRRTAASVLKSSAEKLSSNR